MRPFINHLTRRQPLPSPITYYHQLHHRRRLFATCHSLLNKNANNTSTTSSEPPLPRAASLDSIKSNAPYHFYQTKILEEYVRRPANASTLRQYIFFGRQMTSDRLITAANWVRNELLTRLAHRIRDFQQLPFFVGMNPHIEFVYRLYWGAFEKLRKQPSIETLDDNEEFCKCLEDLLDDGQLVVPKLALGVTECAQHYSGSQDLDRFMNRMLRSRISRRMLAEQHLALTEAHDHGWDMMGEGADGYVGIIFVRCSASDLVSQATRLVRHHAETIYAKPENSGRTPPAIQVNIHQDTQGLQQVEDSKEIVFAYVPEHLEYILFELLSNAVRFTMAAWEQQPEKPYPPIQLTVSANETDVYFRVTDQGGGIPPDVYKHLWSYQARAPSGQFHHFHQVQKMPSNINERATQAADLGHTHLGMGLTMSRILAEYWGGELQVMTMEGFGTDAYVRIPRLGTKAENLGFEDHPAVIPTAVQPNGGNGGGDDMFSNSNTSSHEKKRESSEKYEHHLIQQQPLNWYHPSVIQRNTPANKNNDGGDGWSKSCMVLE